MPLRRGDGGGSRERCIEWRLSPDRVYLVADLLCPHNAKQCNTGPHSKARGHTRQQYYIRFAPIATNNAALYGGATVRKLVGWRWRPVGIQCFITRGQGSNSASSLGRRHTENLLQQASDIKSTVMKVCNSTEGICRASGDAKNHPPPGNQLYQTYEKRLQNSSPGSTQSSTCASSLITDEVKERSVPYMRSVQYNDTLWCGEQSPFRWDSVHSTAALCLALGQCSDTVT